MKSHWVRIFGRRLGQLAGGLFVVQLVFACAGPPRLIRDWLDAKAEGPRGTAKYVIVLGGGGIPSESSLIRSYYAAEFGRGQTGLTFIVALPADGDPVHSSVGRLRDELVLRGIPGGKIQLETHGLNTYQQAANIRRMLGPAAMPDPILVVTSGFHMRRALLCFRKQGFTQVAVLNAAGIDAEADPGWLAYLRYKVWANLVATTEILRELTAITVYKLHGWL